MPVPRAAVVKALERMNLRMNRAWTETTPGNRSTTLRTGSGYLGTLLLLLLCFLVKTNSNTAYDVIFFFCGTFFRGAKNLIVLWETKKRILEWLLR